MLSLIAKDFKLMFSKSGNRLNRLLSLFFNIVISLLFVAIETFIFINIMKKISIYPGANLIFFIIFLAVITVLLTIVCIFSGQKLFFNEEDNNQLSHLPISNEKKILSKLFFLIITMYVLNLIFSFPLFIAYGQMFNKRLFYFYTSLYYPILVSILEIGIALIFIYPVKLLLDYLKKHILIQSIVLIIISFGLCFVYSKILNVFIDLVANNEMNLLFTSESIEVANKISKCLIPINYLVNSFVNGNALFPFICIALGIFIIGLILIFIFYNHFVNFTIENKLNNKKHQIKLTSINKTLIKKELIELFKLNLKNISFIDYPVDINSVNPLDAYCTYTRDQILAGLGYYSIDSMRQGVLYIKDKKTDIFLITLNKSEKEFTPSTRYEDYAINSSLFHWQSQSTTSDSSPMGQRYINHKSMGNNILLFVREKKNDKYGAVPFTLLGSAEYVQHEGSKPMSIVWKLKRPIPARFITSLSRGIAL